MYKNLTLMFALFFIGIPGIVSAGTALAELVRVHDVSSIHIPLPGNCPKTDILDKNKEWVEHTEEWNKNMSIILAIHLRLPLAPLKSPVSFSLLPVSVDRGMGITKWNEIIWSVYRSNQINFNGENNNCYVIGSVAYYVEVSNKNGWPPEVKFLNSFKSERHWLQKGKIGLIEFRWFDPVSKKRHRWFNHRLALYLQWVKRNSYSPISLPRAINTLY